MAALHTPVTSAPNALALDGVGPDSSGGANDQDGLPGPEPADVDQRAQGGGSGHRDHGCLGEGQGGRLGCDSGLVGHGVLGEGAGGDAEDLVPDREPRDRGSRLDDDAGNVAAGNGVLRTGQAHGESHGVWLAGEQVLGAPVGPAARTSTSTSWAPGRGRVVRPTRSTSEVP